MPKYKRTDGERIHSMEENNQISLSEHEHGRNLARCFMNEWKVTRISETMSEWEVEHGQSLGLLFENESQKLQLKDTINKLEIEHGESLALLFENESQRLKLEELNNKLTQSAIIYERDLKMAAKVQRSLLHTTPPETDNLEIAFYYDPLTSVAGDFYDLYTDENNLIGLTLADVSGHGIASGLLTTLAKPIFFRDFRDNLEKPLGKVLEIINDRLIKEMDEAENYLTAVLLRFDGNTVNYANAAHPGIIQKKYNSDFCDIVGEENDELQGSLMGISTLTFPYETCDFTLETGDLLLIYSDCLNESINSKGEQYDKHNIIKTLNAMPPEASAQEILDRVVADLKEYTGSVPLEDDLSIIVLKKK
ncbi:MAG: serine/threonine-protein phosphatase [bacterium]|nr:serine/threonine-protein phosphatase [bacterium]